MAERQPSRESDPRRQTTKLKARLGDVISHALEDGDKVADPKAQALFETTAEVVLGLVRAYDHFEQQSEASWR